MVAKQKKSDFKSELFNLKIHKSDIIIMGIILAIILVVVWLFSLPGPFSPSAQYSPCISASGYTCNGSVYNHLTGNISVKVGQNTGTSWTSANFIFVPQGTDLINGLPNIGGAAFQSPPANIIYSSSGFSSGQIAMLYLPATGPVNAGTTLIGSIWVAYTTEQSSVTQYAQIASIGIKAS